MDNKEGHGKGSTCNRNGCTGIIDEYDYDPYTCYCHRGNPPCSVCCHNYEYCPECGWEPKQP